MASSKRQEMLLGILDLEQSPSIEDDFAGLQKADLSLIHSNPDKNGCLSKMKKKCCGGKKVKKRKKRKKRKRKKHKKLGPKKVLSGIWKVVRRSFSLSDLFTDIALLEEFQKFEMIYAFMFLLFSIFAPYLISYSSGLKHFTRRNTFTNAQGFLYLSSCIIVSPLGIFYFVFIDFLDAALVLVDFLSVTLLKMKKSEIKQQHERWSKLVGMSRMDWEGFKRQRVVGQLLFESLPQLALQSLLAFGVFTVQDFQSCDENGFYDENKCVDSSEATQFLNSNNRNIIILSIITTSINVIFQFVRLIGESLVVEERLDKYALSCILGRVGWIPYIDKIKRLQQDPYYHMKQLDYDIKYTLGMVTSCIGTRGTVEFAFNSVTLRQLSAAISLLDKKSDYRHRRMKIFLRHSCDLVPCHEMVSLMWNCKDKVRLSDITRFDWDTSIDLAAKEGKDIRVEQYGYMGDRIPLLVAILECNFDSKFKIFRQFLERGLFLDNFLLMCWTGRVLGCAVPP